MVPLIKLTRKGVKYVWTEECASVSEQLKNRLIITPILKTSWGTRGMIIYSDASRKGLGCVLIQHRCVIVYASRQLMPHKRNYSIAWLRTGSIKFCVEDIEALSTGGQSVDLHRPQELEVCFHSERVKYETEVVTWTDGRLWCGPTISFRDS